MKVKEIMYRKLYIIDAGETVLEAAKVMKSANIGSLLVKEGTKVVAIVTDKDLVWKALANDKNPEAIKVREIMSSPMIMIDGEEELGAAVDMFVENHIRRVVVSLNGKIAGIVSTQLIAQHLKAALAVV